MGDEDVLPAVERGEGVEMDERASQGPVDRSDHTDNDRGHYEVYLFVLGVVEGLGRGRGV